MKEDFSFELVDNYLWVEKYKPKKLEELKLPDEYRKDFEKFIMNKEIPHILLYGTAGSGKTCTADILCSKNGIINYPDDNVLKINGSAQASRGIGFIDSTILPFLKYPPAGNDKIRIVFIDESDSLTTQAYASMRSLLNEYIGHSRFIMTCNTISKLPDPIQSRFEQGSYLFKQIPKEMVQEHCEHILKLEGVKYNVEDIKYLINNLYPDIRKIVNKLQKCSYENKLQIGSEEIRTKEGQLISNITELIDLAKNGQKNELGNLIQNISEIVDDPSIEYGTVYRNLFYNSSIKHPGIKVKINQYANNHNSCLSTSMHFMSLVFSILEVLKNYGS